MVVQDGSSQPQVGILGPIRYRLDISWYITEIIVSVEPELLELLEFNTNLAI